MDPVVAARMQMDIQVWKCSGIVDGDKNFPDTPTIIKGMAVPKEGWVVTPDGVKVQTKTVIYFNGTDSDALALTGDDEIQVPYGTRMPIQYIGPYQSLGIGWELLEVKL
jgi:hypothetical protein